MALTTVQSGMMDSIAQYNSFKNRIINGAMVIDQRNAGASTTPSGASAGTYTLDRWVYQASATGKFNVQQNLNSITPPTGFSKYLGLSVASAVTVGSTDYFNIYQCIEGNNIADLSWGTASAATVTLSFWVRSSLTGTFGGSLRNGSVNRTYPFNYTISSANTWEQKTITIAGDTSGTWATNNSQGIYITWSLGVGSSYSGGTVNTWNAGNYQSPLSPQSVVGTSGATFYITGVQLEKGSTATAFDYRPYTTELQLCQRYYWQQGPYTTGAGDGLNYVFCPGAVWSNTWHAYTQFPATMRVAPTLVSTAASTFQFHVAGVANGVLTGISTSYATANGARISGGTTYAGTAGLSCQIACANSSTTYLGFSAEL